jgi:hypothetical protein
MNEEQYRQIATQYINKWLSVNKVPAMLVQRWRNDPDLKIAVNVIHDVMHMPAAELQDIFKIEGGEDALEALKQQIPDITVDDLRFSIVTAVILGYWGAEA